MKKVTLGTEDAYPPFNWIDENGDLQGFDVEIGNALCAAANLECTWAVSYFFILLSRFIEHRLSGHMRERPASSSSMCRGRPLNRH